MPDDPVLARYCGMCHNHDAAGQLCTLGLSYAAFVRADAPANGCPGFIDKERAVAEQAQSECRPVSAVTLPVLFQQYQAALGVKP